jgi:predicted esterase YcpF (UPF0227 family)
MSTIIYLHGFGSTGVSPKSQALLEAFPGDTVLAPTMSVTPSEIIDQITAVVRAATSFPVIFVGTSLGGFWANYFAQTCGGIAVIVNPATRPAESLAAKIGKDIRNYQTGEQISITQADIEQYAACRDALMREYNGATIHAFFAKNDEVLDYNVAISDLKFFKTCVVTEDGGHRFDENWGQVVDLLRTIV